MRPFLFSVAVELKFDNSILHQCCFLVIKLPSDSRPTLSTFSFQDINATQRIIASGKSLFIEQHHLALDFDKLTCMFTYPVGRLIIRQHIAQIGLA
jgi:hypothetical protein